MGADRLQAIVVSSASDRSAPTDVPADTPPAPAPYCPKLSGLFEPLLFHLVHLGEERKHSGQRQHM